MTTTRNADDLQMALTHFSGTENYHRTHPGLLATDGAKYLADEAGAYWLFDLVWGVLPKLTEEFAILELSLKEGTDGAELKIHDGRDPETVYHRQEIVRIDFPLPSVTLYIQQNRSDWVVLLRSEY